MESELLTDEEICKIIRCPIALGHILNKCPCSDVKDCGRLSEARGTHCDQLLQAQTAKLREHDRKQTEKLREDIAEYDWSRIRCFDSTQWVELSWQDLKLLKNGKSDEVRVQGCYDYADAILAKVSGYYQAQVKQLVNMIKDLIDDGDCVLDQHGHCQNHGYAGEGVCPNKRAKELLVSLKEG